MAADAAAGSRPGGGLPSFALVGAPRAGTTSLHGQLGRHPQVFMSGEKEPNFFALCGRPFDFTGPGLDSVLRHSVRTAEAYRELFRGARADQAVGESSTQYLYFPNAATAMRRHLPDIKVVAVLRHPVERAFSSFLHLAADGLEPLATFEEALAAEERRKAERWWPSFYYREKGLYAGQVKRYLDAFPADQVRIYLYDDLREDPKGLFRDLFEFLGVSPELAVASAPVVNAAGVPRSRRLQELLQRPGRLKRLVKRVVPPGLAEAAYLALQRRNLAKPELDPATRAALLDGYRADVLALQRLIGRDLSRWLS